MIQADFVSRLLLVSQSCHWGSLAENGAVIPNPCNGLHVLSAEKRQTGKRFV